MRDRRDPSVTHVGLSVSDLDRSTMFYVQAFGFEEKQRYELEREISEIEGISRLSIQFLQLGGTQLELLGFASPPPFQAPSTTRHQIGLTHLSFAVDNLDEAVQLVIDHGGSLIEGTRAAPGAVPQVVFVADPDGTRCELLER